MSRTVLSSPNRTEVQGPVAWEAVLIKIAFPSGTVKLTNHHAPIAWSGDTYTPGYIGDASGAQNLSESVNGTATQSTITLSGVDPALIAAALADDCHWKTVSIWTAYLDYTSGTLINDPIPTQGRKLGVPSFSQGKNSAALNITLDSVLAAYFGKSQVLGNDADQQKRFATDIGFHYTATNLNQLMILGGKQGKVGGKEDPGPGHPPPTISVPPTPPPPPIFPTAPTGTV